MKKIIIFPMLLFALCGKSQMETLFFNQELSKVDAFKDSILQVLPSFKFVENKTSKSGKSQTLLFTDSVGRLLKADILRYSIETQRIGTVQITGAFDAVMSVYSHFVLRGRKIEGAEYCWPVVEKNTPNGVMPISFCKNNKPDSWTLANRVPSKLK